MHLNAPNRLIKHELWQQICMNNQSNIAAYCTMHRHKIQLTNCSNSDYSYALQTLCHMNNAAEPVSVTFSAISNISWIFSSSCLASANSDCIAAAWTLPCDDVYKMITTTIAMTLHWWQTMLRRNSSCKQSPLLVLVVCLTSLAIITSVIWGRVKMKKTVIPSRIEGNNSETDVHAGV